MICKSELTFGGSSLTAATVTESCRRFSGEFFELVRFNYVEHIDEEAIPLIIDALTRVQKGVVFSKCKINEEKFVQAFANMLAENKCQIYVIVFVSCEINVTLILQALMKNKTVEHIQLPAMSHENLQLLAQVLEVNRTLYSLALSDCKITGSGIKMLTPALKNHPTLCHLFLDDNQIDMVGAQALAEVLQTNHTLAALYIRNNPFGVKGVQVILKGLQKNRGITHLAITGRHSFPSRRDEDEMCLTALNETLAVNYTLQRVHMENLFYGPYWENDWLEKGISWLSSEGRTKNSINDYLKRNRNLVKDLAYAILRKNLNKLDRLIKKGVSVNSSMYLNGTPLLLATVWGDEEAVQRILKDDPCPQARFPIYDGRRVNRRLNILFVGMPFFDYERVVNGLGAYGSDDKDHFPILSFLPIYSPSPKYPWQEYDDEGFQVKLVVDLLKEDWGENKKTALEIAKSDLNNKKIASFIESAIQRRLLPEHKASEGIESASVFSMSFSAAALPIQEQKAETPPLSQIAESKKADDSKKPAVQLVVDAKALEQLLKFVVEGEQDQAEVLIKKDSKLLLSAGTVTDLSGRTFENITAFQYALWAMDYHMWTMIQKYLPEAAQITQHERLESKGTAHGSHYDLKPLLDALQVYVDNAAKWNYDQCVDQWCKKVGGAQRLVPVHVVNEYCREDRPLSPCPSEWASPLPRQRTLSVWNGSKWVKKREWFTPASASESLGSSFAFYRGVGSVGSWDGGSGVDFIMALAHVGSDLRSLQALWETRTQQFRLLTDTFAVASKADVGSPLSLSISSQCPSSEPPAPPSYQADQIPLAPLLSEAKPDLHKVEGVATTPAPRPKPSISAPERQAPSRPILPPVTPIVLEMNPEELKRWKAAFPEVSDLKQQLLELRGSVSSAKQLTILLANVAQITPKLAQLEHHQKVLDQELDRDHKTQLERRTIAQSQPLLNYYQTLRKLHYHFLAAQVILSGLVSQADDSMDMLIKGAAQLGKQIPGISLLVLSLEQGSLFAKGIKKHRAMRCLAEWVPNTLIGDRLAERFARQLTLAKVAEIQNPSHSVRHHPTKTLVEKVCAAGMAIYQGIEQIEGDAKQRYRELKEGRSYSTEEQLALADTLLVLEAIMEGTIEATHGVSDQEQLEQHLQKMLSVFKLPKLAPALVGSSALPLPSPPSLPVSPVQSVGIDKVEALEAKLLQMMERESEREAEMARLKAKTERIEREYKEYKIALIRLAPDEEMVTSGGDQAQAQISRSAQDHAASIPIQQAVAAHDRRLIALESHMGVMLEQSDLVPAASTPPLIPASLLVQHGIARAGAEQMQCRLGQAVLAFVAAVNKHLKMEEEHSMGMVWVATVLGALREGKETFVELLAKTDVHALPPELISFVRSYVEIQHNELLEVSSYPEWVRGIERDLYAGKLQGLKQRYGTSKSDQGVQQVLEAPQKSNSDCVLM